MSLFVFPSPKSLRDKRHHVLRVRNKRRGKADGHACVILADAKYSLAPIQTARNKKLIAVKSHGREVGYCDRIRFDFLCHTAPFARQFILRFFMLAAGSLCQCVAIGPLQVCELVTRRSFRGRYPQVPPAPQFLAEVA